MMVVIQPLSLNQFDQVEVNLSSVQPVKYNLSSINRFDIIEERFTGDWRQGQEIEQGIITKRLYQVSYNSSEA